MINFIKIFMCSVLTLLLISGSAMGAPVLFGDSGVGLQGVLDSITINPNTFSSIDVTADALSDEIDSYWNITATGGSISTLVLKLANPLNSNFGVFDRTNISNRVNLFDNTQISGAQTTLSITSLGDIYVDHIDAGINFGSTSFGFYIEEADGGGFVWYSDSALNSDSSDHMVAFQGNNSDVVKIDPWAAGIWTDNEFILAFEAGMPSVSDPNSDYKDYAVMVESVTPVPEPASLLLLGSGLIGVAGLGRRFKKS